MRESNTAVSHVFRHKTFCGNGLSDSPSRANKVGLRIAMTPLNTGLRPDMRRCKQFGHLSGKGISMTGMGAIGGVGMAGFAGASMAAPAAATGLGGAGGTAGLGRTAEACTSNLSANPQLNQLAEAFRDLSSAEILIALMLSGALKGEEKKGDGPSSEAMAFLAGLALASGIGQQIDQALAGPAPIDGMGSAAAYGGALNALA